MMDLYLGDASSELARNRRKISMHTRSQLQRFDHAGSIDLQRAAVVMKSDAGHDAEQPIRHCRRQIPREEVVLPLPPPSRNDVLSACERKHLGNIARIVLQVAIERDDELPASFGKSRRKSSSLPEVAGEANDRHMSVLRLNSCQLVEGRIRAAVVDEDHLVRHAELIEYTGELVVQRHDVLLLVSQRDYDGDLRIEHGEIVSTATRRSRRRR